MKGNLLLIIFFFSAFCSSAQVDIFSVADGPWNDPSTWSPKRIPIATDRVLITHEVSLVNVFSATVENIHINNSSNTNASLDVGINSQLSINADLLVECDNFSGNTGVFLNDNGMLTVTGKAVFVRKSFNNNNGEISLQLAGTSKMNVGLTFVFEMNSRSSVDNMPEILVSVDSDLTITGIASVNNISGPEFDFTISGTSDVVCQNELNIKNVSSRFVNINIASGSGLLVEENTSFRNNSFLGGDFFVNVDGVMNLRKDFNINTLYVNSDLFLNVDGVGAQVRVLNNLNLSAANEEDILIDLQNEAKFYLGGNLTRSNAYGNIDMSSDAFWIYNGTEVQDIPNSAGNGTDELNFTNVEFASDADSVVLTGDFVVTGNFNLTKGILKTSQTAMLIIEDGASISGGAADAYVDGPMKKISSAMVAPFTFPLGDEGRFAPITIEASAGRSAAGGEYIGQYYNCPPPWEVDGAPGLTQISDEEFWSLSRTPASEPVNIALHWTDAAAQGITNTDSLVVAMYNPPSDPSPLFAPGWNNIGQGDLVIDGIAGSISNIGTCPPPWEVDNFTFGSTDASNRLPVNMESFAAKLNGLIVDLDWTTNTEINADHYMVERSTDGVNFSSMNKVEAKGYQTGGSYFSKDLNPLDGANYYRLRQVDADGMFSFTNIVSVFFDEKPALTVFPNPFNEGFVLKGEQLDQAESIRVLDNTGRMIMLQPVNTEDGFLNFEASSLNIEKPGIYFIEIRSKQGTEVLRLMKG